ncbi:MAG TPA: hypothetical protein VNS19_23265 [Acidimicrobiales bacterium]|jgi:hypothetical protein|nr:hypothetical protein [Acidimicrobiales bacterium]
MESTSLQFAATVRTLGAAARERGLVVPGFRSPPRRPGAERTLRWSPDGSATIAVAMKGRPYQAVVADLIEGVVVVNQLDGIEATRLRTALWEAIVAAHADAAWRGAA